MSGDKTKAMALAYLDARDVMDRFDEVMGPGNWQVDYVPIPNGTTCCRIGLTIGPGAQWIWKANGAGNTDIEAEKGAYSDAFKRAAVLWGVGRYLYGIKSPWVRINQYKQIEDDELPRLQALLRGEKPKSAYESRRDGDYPKLEAGLRACSTIEALGAFWKDNQEAILKLPAGWQQSLTQEKDRLKAELKVAA